MALADHQCNAKVKALVQSKNLLKNKGSPNQCLDDANFTARTSSRQIATCSMPLYSGSEPITESAGVDLPSVGFDT
jgi:hypothetical protein